MVREFPGYWKRAINIVLPVFILGDMIFYQFCLSSCSYLRGDILGLEMKYVGLIVPIPLIILAAAKRDLLYALALAFGIGGEIKLVAFQIQHGVYCPYCLFAAAIMLFLFLFNFNRSRKAVMIAFVVIGFLFFELFFHGAATPSYDVSLLLRPVGLLSFIG